MAATFTPGPWKAQRLSNEIEIGAQTPEGGLSVAWVHLGEPPHVPADVEAALADACLLAAAPDLLAALREVLDSRGAVLAWSLAADAKEKDMQRVYQRANEAEKVARAAIARATGGTP